MQEVSVYGEVSAATLLRTRGPSCSTRSPPPPSLFASSAALRVRVRLAGSERTSPTDERLLLHRLLRETERDDGDR
eukprot:475371-Hanusia_phi.AAC.2